MALYSELVTVIKADNKDFNNKISESRSKTAAFGKDIAKFGGIAATAIGVTAVSGFLVLLNIINNTTDEISKLVDTANRLGGSVGGLQKLQYAAQLSGVSAEELEGGMTKLARALISADKEGSSVGKSLEFLGLSAQKLSGMSIDQQYIAVAEAIGKIGDKSLQTKLAFEFFGKSGIKQLSLIRDGVSSTFAEFDKLGASLTDKQAAAVDSYGDSIDKLKATFTAFSYQLTAAAAPALEEVINWIQQSIIAAGGLGEVGKAFGGYFIDGIILAVQSFQKLLDIVSTVKVGFLQAQLAGAQLLETLNNSALGGDFNFERSFDIARLKRDIERTKGQSTDVTSGLVSGLNNAKSAIDTGGQTQKVEIIVKPGRQFEIEVAQSYAVSSAVSLAISKLASSEAASTIASRG